MHARPEHASRQLQPGLALCIIPAVNKLLTLLIALLGCLAYVGQVSANSAARYSDCCVQGCHGMAHCVSDACQSCAAPQSAPPGGSKPQIKTAGSDWLTASVDFAPGAAKVPWRPPD